MKPELRLDILQILKDTLDIPLVLQVDQATKMKKSQKQLKSVFLRLTFQVISRLHSMINVEKY